MTFRGELWPQDKFGRVENAADRARVPALARRVSRAVAEAYRTRLGEMLHSVYLTGPAARGREGPVEAFGVLRMTSTPIGEAWLDETAGVIRARWPAAGLPKLELYRWREVFPDGDAFSPARFRIGVNSVCLYGRDLGRALAPQKLSVAATNAWLVTVRERLGKVQHRLELGAREDEVAREAAQAARFLLTAGFALVMPHEAVYTEDPELQREFIAMNFPERADDVRALYALYEVPPREADVALPVLERYGRWFLAECDRWLDRHNPQRLQALPA